MPDSTPACPADTAMDLHCPLCEAMRTPVLLAVFHRRIQHFLLEACACADTSHRVLVQHPHTQPGCVGYAWQGVPPPAGVPCEAAMPNREEGSGACLSGL